MLPPVTFVMNRDERFVRLKSPFGDNIELKVNDRVTLLQLQHELRDHFDGFQLENLTFHQGDEELKTDSRIDPEQPVEFTYTLRGGAGCSTITTCPDVARIHCLCEKCGLTHFPKLGSDDWCVSTCCCLHHECGMHEWKVVQLCCLKANIAPLGCHTVSRIPEALNLRFLCVKCGIKHLPDFTRDDWQTANVCCLYQNCGPKDLFSPQILCIKCHCL